MSKKQVLSTDDTVLPKIEKQRIAEEIGEHLEPERTEDTDYYLTTRGKVEIKPYNPITQHKVIRDRLHALEIINDRFARQFRIGLFNLLRRHTDVIAHPVEIQPYHQFAAEVSSPVCLNLMHFAPLRGMALFLFSPELIYIAVDNLFGGQGRLPIRKEDREFTPTEQRVIQRLLNLALELYQDAWKDIFTLDITFVRSEMQIKFTNITTSPNDIVLNTSFTIEIAEFSGKFNICIPFAMIEPLRELLVNPPIEYTHKDENVWRSSLTSGITQSEIELSVNFATIKTTVADVLSLGIGDILPIEKPGILEATVGGVSILKGHYGKSNKHYALQVEEVINPGIEQLNEEFPHD